MKVYEIDKEFPKIKNPVLTLGTFDGVHLGHQKILRFLKEGADRHEGETVLFTFFPHPRMVLHPDDHNLSLIQTIEKRIEMLDRFGLDNLILYPFTKEFSRTPATEFIRDIMVNQLSVKMMTIGYNHHFGRNREGSIQLLEELGHVYDFEVKEIPALRVEEKSISSTKIRNAILEGDILTANEYLGRSFGFEGTVVQGNQIGSQIGFPTANIDPKGPHQLIPEKGVYAVKAKIAGKIYSGMCNIGYRPTVTSSGERRIELHIFNFDQRIYGEELELFFINRIREEVEFASLDELKAQLKKDEESCRTILDVDSTPVH
ncbi:MAG: bifunctional riboflavin kinase/FAD synthetase [Flavobacteriales bacterium]|nr:bifunctional riboflavin kinase/FAD synthetase [Flavobacteriales bacterium]